MCSGGSKGVPGSSAPWGPNSFVFTEFFWEIWQNRMLVPPWICHWCDSRNKIYFCKWFKIYSLFLVLIQGMWSISTTDSKNIVYFCHWFKEYSLFLPLIQEICQSKLFTLTVGCLDVTVMLISWTKLTLFSLLTCRPTMCCRNVVALTLWWNQTSERFMLN